MHRQWVGCAPQNFRKGRPAGFRPEAIVIHIICGSLASASAHFNNPASAVSAHYAVGRDGRVLQFVEETDTAFHAGVIVSPTWASIRAGFNPNFYTIGIEHEGQPEDEWTELQYAASSALVAEIAARWQIPLDANHIVLHREIRASKTCPGSRFERAELLRRAISVVPPSHDFIAVAEEVQTTGRVNIREDAPSTLSRVVRVAAAGSAVQVSGYTVSGERVSGNASWYRTLEGDYLWAGATTEPHPESREGEVTDPGDSTDRPTPNAAVACGIARVDHLLAGTRDQPIRPGDPDRSAVGAIQDLLIGHGYGKLPGLLASDRGIFGTRTAEAVGDFQARCRLPVSNDVDQTTLKRLLIEQAQDPRATQAYLTLVLGFPFTGMIRVLCLVAQLEGIGRFAAQNRNTDKAGLSFGIIQWAQKPGRLQEILRAFQQAHAQTFVEIFAGGDLLLANRLVAHAGRPGGGVDSKTGLSLDAAFELVVEPWTTRFETAARRPEYQKVQVQVALAAFQRSLKALKSFAPELQSERAVAFMIDVANQFGDRGAKNLYKAVKRPNFGERQTLEAIAGESILRMPEAFRRGVTDRRNAFLNTPWLSDLPVVETSGQAGAAKA